MSKMVTIDWNPDARTLRHFGWIALGGFGLIAMLAWFEWLIFSFGLGAARPYVAGIAMGLGVVGAFFSLVYPPANRVLYVGLSIVAYPIGFVLSHVLLAALFFGLFAPVGILFRVFRRDPMHRRWDPDAPSYWVPARASRGSERYFRQF